MRVDELLAKVMELKPNQYEYNILIDWLSALEGKIVKEIFETHEQEEPVEFHGYTESDMNAELLVIDPYADLYKYYLFAMIDFNNGETDRYANSMIMFNNAYAEYRAWYNRTHMPLYKPLRVF